VKSSYFLSYTDRVRKEIRSSCITVSVFKRERTRQNSPTDKSRRYRGCDFRGFIKRLEIHRIDGTDGARRRGVAGNYSNGMPNALTGGWREQKEGRISSRRDFRRWGTWGKETWKIVFLKAVLETEIDCSFTTFFCDAGLRLVYIARHE